MTRDNHHRAAPTADQHCPECGALVNGGRPACEVLFDTFRYAAVENPRLAAVHRLAFDAYCMQHIETYCVSAKSYAAHLTGLCCGIEHNGDETIYRAIPAWLNGKVILSKPALLTQRGFMTFADIAATHDIDEKIRRVHEWANIVWAAYSSQHDLARQLLQTALEHTRKGYS